MASVGIVLLFFLAPQVLHGGLSLFIERVLAGLDRGAVYATLAVALMLVFSSASFVNLAQGQLAMIGAFIAYVLAVPREDGLAGGRAMSLDGAIGSIVGWDGFTVGPLRAGLIGAILVAMVFSAGLGLAVERLLRPFGPGDDLPPTLVTLGLFVICGSFTTWLWGHGPRPFPNLFPDGPDDHLRLGGAEVPWDTIGAFVVLGIVAVVVHRLLDEGSLTRPRAWALAAALGTLAATLIAPELFVTPELMLTALAFALAAAVTGGFGSLRRIAAAGVGAGVIEAVVVGYLADIDSAFSVLSLAVAFGIIVMVLWLRGPATATEPSPTTGDTPTTGGTPTSTPPTSTPPTSTASTASATPRAGAAPAERGATA
ncbi:MAG: hypothetical protein AAF962_10600 [Actinomycetota bacterium]